MTADLCPRISDEFLADERAALGERVFAAEYDCEFMAADSVFDSQDIAAAMTNDLQPLGDWRTP